MRIRKKRQIKDSIPSLTWPFQISNDAFEIDKHINKLQGIYQKNSYQDIGQFYQYVSR